MKPYPLTLLITMLLASLATAELVVDLDARTQPDGAISSWINQGSLGGTFAASGSPVVEAVDGVKGVTYNGNSWHVGPRSTPEMDGTSDRSIQVWLYNPAVASEETIVSWGHRGGPDGSNMSFNHGTHNAFGAVGHWGNGPDIGWDPSETADNADTGLGQEETAIWTNIAYTQTGSETRVFTNGILTTSEEIDIDTHANQAIVIAAQQDGPDSNSFAVAATLTIAKVQIWDSALPDGQIAFNYNNEAAKFGRALAAITDSDGDGLPDDMEAAVGLNPNVADANGDEDGDGVSNLVELELGSDLTSDDSDDDGLGDAAEVTAGTSLTNADTDGDGINDKAELDAGLDPTNIDTDGDGAPDNVEQDAGTDPKDPDSSPNTIILVRDTTDSESWETPAVWSSGAGAEADKSYVISTGAGSVLRTPKGPRASFPAGARLTLSSDSAVLELLNPGNTHFDQLTIQSGTLALGGSRGGVSGSLTLGSDLLIDLGSGRRINFDATLSGSGNLTLTAEVPDFDTVATLSGTSDGYTGEEVQSNGVLVEFAGLRPIGDANFSFFEGGMRLINNVLLPESTLGIGGTNFFIDLNGGTAVFKSINGIDGDRNVLFEIPAGVYDRNGLLGFGFNEDTVGEFDGLLVVLGESGDSDNDGLWDQWETDTFGDLAQTSDGDADGDTLTNGDEFRARSDPQKADTDEDGLNDRQELLEAGSNPLLADTDGDGVSDADEFNRVVDGQPAATNANFADTDGDGLLDGVETNDANFAGESATGTDPLVADTDGDGWPDGSEIFEGGTDPTDPNDTPTATPSLVSLDARALPVGPIASWRNLGGLGGSFDANGDPEVEEIDGVRGVALDDSEDWLIGPAPSEELLGNSERTIEAWIFNPEIEPEETVISWGRRGGPNGTNMAFNHGTHNAFGAVGHWGGDGPDIGWDPGAQSGDEDTGTGREEANIWTHISYVWTGDITNVYTNGTLTNTESPGSLDTFAESNLGEPLPMVVGNQNEPDGTQTDALKGIMTLSVIKVYNRAFSDDEILATYNASATEFGRDPFVPGDSDEDGLPDLWEVNVFGDLSQTGDGDFDEDGLTNAEEKSGGTDPTLADTDGDGFSDSDEIGGGTDPLDVTSFPETVIELLVSLDATTLPEGAIDTWENTGSLAGDFTGNEGPLVIAVDGVNGVDFDGVAYFEGPKSVPTIEGRSARTIEAWVHNPEIADEETVVAWSRRGGGGGTNVSFNHGAHPDFGAVGHWGAPDIGWAGDEETDIWSHITYTYDGATTRVYTNGELSDSEDVVLDTAGGNGILIAAQREGDNETVTGALRGDMTIAKVRIYDGALSEQAIAESYSSEAVQFGRMPISASVEKLVDLDATTLDAGVITEWANAGTLGGTFAAGGAPQVIEVDGVKGIDFDGSNDYFDGPVAPESITGSNARTIEAWVHNPEIADEETVVAWAQRGGPDGGNVSFNHGAHPAFGAVGHWGGADIGWNGDEVANIWTYITYTYDGSTTRVYTNGALSDSEDVALDSTAGNGILIAAQREGDGTAVTGALRGDMTIAKVRVWAGALSDSDIASTWETEGPTFGRVVVDVDEDGDGLPDAWEQDNFGDFSQGADDDSDDDGLDNAAELAAGTAAGDPDSDNDGFSDGEESTTGSDPLDVVSVPDVAITALVQLDASGLADGVLDSWSNTGTLRGAFAASGDPTVEVIDGAKGVTLDGEGDWLVGPTTPLRIEGAGARTVEAWVYNPEIGGEETVVGWGRRGGPDSSNVSFNHGTHNTFGAVGHWGGADIGWDPSTGNGDDDTGQGHEESGKWTHIAYTQDRSTTRIYTNGGLTNSEEGITLNTHGGQGILIGAQWEGDGITVNEALSGSLSVGLVRIYDGALTADELAAAYNETKANFTGGGGGVDPTGTFVIDTIARNEANNEVSLAFQTEVGVTYTVQHSQDLVIWTDIMTINGNGASASFSDTDAVRIASTLGYYRVASP